MLYSRRVEGGATPPNFECMANVAALHGVSRRVVGGSSLVKSLRYNANQLTW
jgi:hypothetical protein